MGEEKESYGIGERSSDAFIDPPAIDYRPRTGLTYNPEIALIGCGGISAYHLKAYQQAGYQVTALCDVDRDKAETARKDFFPEAKVTADYREILKRDTIEVVDIATHPEERESLLRSALTAGKHVLSQKPFVLDLDTGREIVDLAEKRGVQLAVNQNGRWAPHFRYMTEVVAGGHIGTVTAVHMSVTWNHNWIAGTPFENIPFLILYDFGIHWFDMMTVLMGDRQPTGVFASAARAQGQTVKPPFLSQCVISYQDAQGSISFDADARVGQEDRTLVVGTQGMITSVGPDLLHQELTLHTEKGVAKPTLEGNWFAEGFHGTMAELLYAVQEDRPPSHNARDNLKSLALCFTAVESAATGEKKTPGKDGRRLHS